MSVDVQRVLQPLRVRYVAPLARGFDSFWSWWTGELVSMLPQSIRASMAARNQRLFVESEGRDIVLRQGTAGEMLELMRLPLDAADGTQAWLPLDARDTVLLLPADKVLIRALTLPLAAEENLREVLAFEMDRQTPFTADQVYYDFAVTARKPESQELQLDLVFSPRAVVDTMLDALAQRGIAPDVATIRAAKGGELQPVNLLPADKRPARRNIVHRLHLVLGGLAVLLIVAAVATPLLQKERIIRTLQPQLEAAIADATEGNKLRQDVEKLAEGSTFLIGKKQSNLLVVQVVNEVSRILPDHTWLNRLDIRGDELQLQGQSASAADLIAILESSAFLQNARFRSPVIQIPRTNEERFHVSADVIWEQGP